jgi:hypothetical protein
MMRREVSIRGAFAAAFGLGLATLAVLSDASARTSFDSPYTLDQTYNCALRYVRVELGMKVTEKDPQAAYVLFDYRSAESGDKVSAGAIEMVPSGQSIKVVIQLSQMPRYHEQVIADSFSKKLRDEYGEPPKKAPPAPLPPDGGADGSAD